MTKKIPFSLVRSAELTELQDRARSLESQIETARGFIKQIETGNLDIAIAFDGDEGESALAESLTSMRDQMRKISVEERQRNWATEGLAKFVHILRSNNDDLKALAQVIISNIVKYTESNQGSLYITNEENGDEYLDLVGCYAYDRKKHVDRRIGMGEGLVGQCVLEKSTVYMTNLPSTYLKITSGLGEALPKNLLIVPLILNDVVYGAIELASFTTFESYHRDFLEKLAESIASTIANVKVNEQTKKLLQETQIQAEQVRAQEEEMRQNMEELSATQEEMQRVLREVEGKEAYVSQLLNVSTESIYTVDRKYLLTSWNKSFGTSLEKFGMRVEKGMDTVAWHQGYQRTEQAERYDRAFAGESFDFMISTEHNGRGIHHMSIYSPLRNAAGEVTEVAVFSKDMSEVINARKKAEQAAADALNQAEELKSQEEELRQNMEELAATQDEMQRILNEVQSKEAYLHALLNSAKDAIFTVDKDLAIISFNEGFTAGLKGLGVEMVAGFKILDIFPGEEQKVEQRGYYARAFAGEVFEVTSLIEIGESSMHYTSNYSPLRNDKGEVFAVSVFGNDVTEIFTAKLKAEQMAKEAQEKTEELKAQEEELRQNMEELSSTQEEMERIMREMEAKSKYTMDLLNASDDLICTIDRRYKLVNWNKTFEDFSRGTNGVVEKGFDTLQWYKEGKERAEYKAAYERTFQGKIFVFDSVVELGDKKYNVHTSYKPLGEVDGIVYEIVMFTRLTPIEEKGKKGDTKKP